MKKILSFTNGGLGNRFFNLLTAYYFAHRTNSLFNIIWYRNFTCEAGWSDLFETNSNKISVCDIDPQIMKLREEDFVWITHNLESYISFREKEIPAYFFSNSLFYTNEDLKKINYQQLNGADEILNVIESIEDHKMISITDCNPTLLSSWMNTPWSPNYDVTQVIKDFFRNVFVIEKDIIDEVETFCKEKNIDEKTVGFHFRSIHLGHIDIGYASFKIEEAINSGAKNIFLCADNKDAEVALTRQWPNHVITYTKKEYLKKQDEASDWIDFKKFKGGYNVLVSKEAAINSLIDCIILSKTNMRSLLVECNQHHSWPGTFFLMASYMKQFGKN